MNDQELFERIGQMRQLAEKNLPIVRSYVDVFVSKKITDEKEIEIVLDTLLDYVMLDVGKEEFERLNTYYESVNKGNADFYWHHYRDLLGF